MEQETLVDNMCMCFGGLFKAPKKSKMNHSGNSFIKHGMMRQPITERRRNGVDVVGVILDFFTPIFWICSVTWRSTFSARAMTVLLAMIELPIICYEMYVRMFIPEHLHVEDFVLNSFHFASE